MASLNGWPAMTTPAVAQIRSHQVHQVEHSDIAAGNMEADVVAVRAQTEEGTEMETKAEAQAEVKAEATTRATP